MAKSDYLESKDKAFAVQLITFKNGIGGYVALFGLTPLQVSGQAADADYFDYLVKGQDAMQNSDQQWTTWKDIIRNGGPLPPGGAPAAPALPAAVPAVAPGLEARFRALVKAIKANPNYNPAIGQALGIEGAAQTGPDLTTIQPDFGATVSGNQVTVGWGWGGNSNYLDMIRLEVDRDGKGYVLLATDTTPGYVDTMPFPSTPTKWTYRGIYMVGDQKVGQWSKPVSVTVGG